MNPIFSALRQGFSPAQVLQFISRMNPTLATQIASATAAGYTANTILNFLQRGGKLINQVLPDADKSPKSSMEQAIYGVPSHVKNALKVGAGVAAAAVGSPILGRALSGMAGQVPPPVPQAGGMPQIPLGGMQGGQPPLPPMGQQPIAPQPPIPPTAAGPIPAVQQAGTGVPQGVAPIVPQGTNPLVAMGVHGRVANMIKAGNGKEAIRTVLNVVMTPKQKRWVKENAVDIDKAIEDFAVEVVQQESAVAQPEATTAEPRAIQPTKVQEPITLPTQQAEALRQKLPPTVPTSEAPVEPMPTLRTEQPTAKEREEPGSIDVGATVWTNGGSEGVIERIDGDNAVVKVGKRRMKYNLQDLRPPDEEMVQAVSNLLDVIPEEDKSAVLGFASFNFGVDVGGEEIPIMALQFIDSGEFGLFLGATKEDFEAITGMQHVAKTDGENAYHTWVKGKASRGASFNEIKKKLEERFGDNYIKFPPHYDQLKVLRDASKVITKRKQKAKSQSR